MQFLKGIGLILLSSICMNAFAQKIDPQKSSAIFNVSKLGFSNVSGTFTGMEGKIVFNPESMTSNVFNVCIKTATVVTGEADRDKHLREKDFFHAQKYPNICFTSTSMLKTKTGYLVTGKVNIKGKTKRVNIPFTFINNTFKGTLRLNRKDFDLNDGTGMFVIGEMVDIEIVCVVS